MEIRDLRLVQAMHLEKTTTAAARRLGLTQSAVSHQLRNLEDRLQTEVFQRKGRGLVMTEAGERILELAGEVLGAVSLVERDITAGRTERWNDLKIASQCFTAYHWLPEAVTQLQRSHPDTRLKIMSHLSEPLSEAVTIGKVDVALCINPPSGGAFRRTRLFRDELVLVASPNHPLAQRPFVTGADLIDEPMFLYSFAKERSAVRKHLFPGGGGLSNVTFLPLTEAILELVRADLGLSVLAGWSAARYVERGEVVCVRLGRRGLLRHWYGCYRAENELLGPVRCLLRTLRGLGGPVLHPRGRKPGPLGGEGRRSEPRARASAR